MSSVLRHCDFIRLLNKRQNYEIISSPALYSVSITLCHMLNLLSAHLFSRHELLSLRWKTILPHGYAALLRNYCHTSINIYAFQKVPKQHERQDKHTHFILNVHQNVIYKWWQKQASSSSVDFVPASFIKLRYRISTSQGMQIKNVKELL